MDKGNFTQLKTSKSKGQSMVEMAIVAPLLIFMLIGLFEVGYIIRSFMVLDNVVRESARFASKPGNIDFDAPDPGLIGYNNVISHTLASISGQIPVDFEESGTIVISLYDIPPQFPCDPELREEPIGNDMWPNCNCKLAVLNPYQPLMIDHPGYSTRLGYSKPLSVASRIDHFEMIDRLGRQQLEQMCALGKVDLNAPPTSHRMVMVEIWYDHYQLFGFPLIATPYTNPIELYSRTVMRYADSREPEPTPTGEEE